MKVVDNYESKIWLGLQEGYSGIEENPKTIKGFIEGWCTGKRQRSEEHTSELQSH